MEPKRDDFNNTVDLTNIRNNTTSRSNSQQLNTSSNRTELLLQR